MQFTQQHAAQPNIQFPFIISSQSKYTIIMIIATFLSVSILIIMRTILLFWQIRAKKAMVLKHVSVMMRSSSKSATEKRLKVQSEKIIDWKSKIALLFGFKTWNNGNVECECFLLAYGPGLMTTLAITTSSASACYVTYHLMILILVAWIMQKALETQIMNALQSTLHTHCQNN